jgi:hypothetical protein
MGQGPKDVEPGPMLFVRPTCGDDHRLPSIMREAEARTAPDKPGTALDMPNR